MPLSLTIHGARHGWLELELVLAEQRVSFAASDVLNDPVRELADLALFIARRGVGSARASFWLEPAGYELRAVRDWKLDLALVSAREAYPNITHGELVAEESVDAIVTARHIASQLRLAQQLLAGRTAWKYGFPDDTLLAVWAALTDTR